MDKFSRRTSFLGWVASILIIIYAVLGHLFAGLGFYAWLFNDDGTQDKIMTYLKDEILLVIAIILNMMFLYYYFKEKSKYGKYPPDILLADISSYLRKKGYEFDESLVIDGVIDLAGDGNLIIWAKDAALERDYKKLHQDEIRNLAYDLGQLINIGGKCYHQPSISKKEIKQNLSEIVLHLKKNIKK